ncbi:ubiquinone biosynthesis accessory factor UbiJ [Bowmanella dokdonensis]|uniref:Ubiquinone biosynthesis accessory factor UbiJ n=1 Tax=Bowmanella dokdonensis TaxID=751969 RepID=A0A939DL12_9ALTE|nr:SCP2 sterol-binding domain-containing protein [Bowmanella dokdonensis]MBN7823736.1 SCP2 sterol-binding domain-containing protein [Bowmanella dokdonensis]
MPAPQLMVSALELALNKLLHLDPLSGHRLQPLAGKRLRIQVRELPWPLTFAFSDQVDLLLDEDTEVDCSMSLSLSTLKDMQDVSQIGQLIQQQRLSLHGDMHTAQSFSNLLKELDIDWEEQLSCYVGDVLAHQTLQFFRSARIDTRQRLERLRQMLSDGALQEKKLAAHPLALEDFSEQVSQLRGDAARFEARLTQLEQIKAGK